MKKHMILSGIFISLIFISYNSWGVMPPITTCANETRCCSGGYTGFCCATGEFGTTLSCPSGWTLNLNNICARPNTTGSDTTGYYTITYGTCAPDEIPYACFERATPSGTSDCLKCQVD